MSSRLEKLNVLRVSALGAVIMSRLDSSGFRKSGVALWEVDVAVEVHHTFFASDATLCEGTKLSR